MRDYKHGCPAPAGINRFYPIIGPLRAQKMRREYRRIKADLLKGVLATHHPARRPTRLIDLHFIETAEGVAARACQFYDIDTDDLFDPTHAHANVRSRQWFYHALYLLGFGYLPISKIDGVRDHTTILYGIYSLAGRLDVLGGNNDEAHAFFDALDHYGLPFWRTVGGVDHQGVMIDGLNPSIRIKPPKTVIRFEGRAGFVEGALA